MKLLTVDQIREAEAYTIKKEGIKSIDLMERAAKAVFSELMLMTTQNDKIGIYCGPGNNGGDGLAVARMLALNGRNAEVILCCPVSSLKGDSLLNYQQLGTVNVFMAEDQHENYRLDFYTLVVDALFGTGLNKPLTGIYAELINAINTCTAQVVAIDIPSGMYCDSPTPSSAIVARADITFTFDRLKHGLIMADNGNWIGSVKVLDIGLDRQFTENLPCQRFLLEADMIKQIIGKRGRFTHKGDYGHALLVGGNNGKTGAIMMAAQACVRSGAGLTSVLSNAENRLVLQTTVPEAMFLDDTNFDEKKLPDFKRYQAIAIGPGLGINSHTRKLIQLLINESVPRMILDADALSLISEDKNLLTQMAANTILTPHVKEFERIFGPSDNGFDRENKQLTVSKQHGLIIVLKGAYTSITSADGKRFYNTTGNAGLAKGGSGDVLTGIIAGLLAQGKDALEATLAGVYLHGLAADLAVADLHEMCLSPRDIIAYLPKAFQKVTGAVRQAPSIDHYL